jgi:hypothetical protein
VKKIATVVSLMVSAFTVVIASSFPAKAADKLYALISPPLSINANDGQPMCLVSNISTSITVPVKVEIFDGTGATILNAQFDLLPGTIEGPTDSSQNFNSYCRITPANPSHLSLIRGSHCSVYSNSVKACVEAR